MKRANNHEPVRISPATTFFPGKLGILYRRLLSPFSTNKMHFSSSFSLFPIFNWLSLIFSFYPSSYPSSSSLSWVALILIKGFTCDFFTYSRNHHLLTIFSTFKLIIFITIIVFRHFNLTFFLAFFSLIHIGQLLSTWIKVITIFAVSRTIKKPDNPEPFLKHSSPKALVTLTVTLSNYVILIFNQLTIISLINGNQRFIKTSTLI